MARFVGEDAMTVDDRRITARHFLLATGSVPRPLGIRGAELVIAIDGFLELVELPARIPFVGGGCVLFEFAHMAVRAGSDVQIIDSGTQQLRNFAPDLVEKLVQRSWLIGIKLDTRTTLRPVERSGSDLVVVVGTPEGEKWWTVDLVVHGAGRVAAIEQLDIGARNIEATRSGVVLNEYLQSVSNPAVHVAGDAAAPGGIMLTPVAVYEA